MGKIIVTGNDQRRDYELGAVNTVGRHPDNTLQILDRIVSKEHAQIIRQPDGRFLFRDLGSLNGSFLRGERLNEHILIDGDEITFTHTEVPKQAEGKGIAGRLVADAMAYARGANLRVIPQCAYVAAWLKRHHEYDDILHPEYRQS